MATSVGNQYSATGWYTPTYYNNRTASDWATGKNTRPDNYTKDELKEHYDFVYNEPVSKLRPDKPLPEDADEQRYDWVFNIRSNEGRWQLHNPNGLNAHRDGLSPYDWSSSKTSGASSSSRTVSSKAKSTSFDAAFSAAVESVSAKSEAMSARTAQTEKAVSTVSDTVADLRLNNANRNSVLQQMLRLGTSEKPARISNATLLNLLDEDDEKKTQAAK